MAADFDHLPNRVIYLVWLSYSEKNSIMPFDKNSVHRRNEENLETVRREAGAQLLVRTHHISCIVLCTPCVDFPLLQHGRHPLMWRVSRCNKSSPSHRDLSTLRVDRGCCGGDNKACDMACVLP